MNDDLINVPLADHNQDHVLLLTRELEQDGSLTVDVPEDGLARLDKFAPASYDVLLPDYKLPKADEPGGSETC
jgi:CheY-like chemotaxis protein